MRKRGCQFESDPMCKLKGSVMKQQGNKANAILNGEWAKHVRRWGKKATSKIRRTIDKKLIFNAKNS